MVIPDAGSLDLMQTTRAAWALGVPFDFLAICEDNGDYFCLDGDTVRFWSHDGATSESWPDLATWITEVWLGENG